MHGDDDGALVARYGIWPTIAGFALGGGLTWFMFAVADGFS